MGMNGTEIIMPNVCCLPSSISDTAARISDVLGSSFLGQYLPFLLHTKSVEWMIRFWPPQSLPVWGQGQRSRGKTLMAWRPAEASCPRSAWGTTTGRAEAGNRRQGEDADAPQTARRFFPWLGTQTVCTPQSSALEKGNWMEGFDRHGEGRKVKAETTCVPSLFCPGTDRTCHVARRHWMNDTQRMWRKGQDGWGNRLYTMRRLTEGTSLPTQGV